MAPITLGVYVRLDASPIEVSGAEGFIRARQGGLTGPVLDLQSQCWTFGPLVTASAGDPINRTGTAQDPTSASLGSRSTPVTGFCNRGANGFVPLWDIAIFNAINNNPIPDNTYLIVSAAGPPPDANFRLPT